MIPEKLREGDEIQVIAPARSMAMLGQDTIDIAKANFEAMGLKIGFGEHVMERDDFVSSSIESRVSDLEEAFEDKNVRGILTVIGGFNSNQLLRYIDYEKIKNNPKVFCGYSDISILNNAFYSVAVSMEDVTFGRQIKENETLYTFMNDENERLLRYKFDYLLTDEDRELNDEISAIKRKNRKVG